MDQREEVATRPVPVKADKKAEMLEGLGRAAKKWDDNHKGKGKQAISIPGSDEFVSLTQLTVEDNKVSVWTSEDTNGAPDFVIVNPPSKVFVDKETIIDNPLGAIAYIINGATK